MITFLLILIAVPVTQDEGRASERPTAESIIERFVNAKGGKHRLLSVSNYSISGTIDLVNEGERTTLGKFQIYQAAGRSKTLITLPDGTVISHGTDGRIAWSIGEHGFAKILEGQEARDFIRHHMTLHESLAWPELFETIRYAGKKTIDGVETHHVVFLAADNRQINRYFRTKDGFLVREEQFVGPSNSFQIATFSDYQPCPNGVMVARKKSIMGNGLLVANTEYRITAVSPNLDDIEKHLDLPEAIAELLGDEKND